MVQEQVNYVGERIRLAIKRKMVKNGYVISALNGAGVKMTESQFSNKIYGIRSNFTDKEVKEISKILKTSF